MQSLEWIESKVKPVAKAMGCLVWGIVCEPQGRGFLLRIYVDRPAGATVDDCQRISRQLSALFEVEPPTTGHYVLEVSTPGMDRILFTQEQYLAYIGQKVKVKLKMQVAGARHYKGELAAVDLSLGKVGSIALTLEDKSKVVLSFADILQTRLVPDFTKAGGQ